MKGEYRAFCIKQQTALHKTVTGLRYCSVFGIDSYESTLTVTVGVPEHLRSTAKAGDVIVFYKKKMDLLLSHCWSCVLGWSYSSGAGISRNSGLQPHCYLSFSDYEKVTFVCLSYIGPCYFQ